MAKLAWDKVGERLYETGIEKGVLFVYDEEQKKYKNGVAWNGIVSVSESPSGAEPSPVWADNSKYLNIISKEEFAATIEAYMYPDEFAECDGTAQLATGVRVGQQPRKSFAFAYTTKVGSDTEGDNKGEKLHIIYGCRATPSEKQYSTVNDSPEAITFSWSISTTPVNVTGRKPTSLVVIDSTKFSDKGVTFKKITDKLWGTDGEGPETDSTLLEPDDIKKLVASAAPMEMAAKNGKQTV